MKWIILTDKEWIEGDKRDRIERLIKIRGSEENGVLDRLLRTNLDYGQVKLDYRQVIDR